jgi:signal transduction histidine kinase
MLERTGLGETGETYLVDQGNLLLTDLRLGAGAAHKTWVFTEGADRALSGETGVGLYPDDRGEPVIGAYRWLEGREMALLAEIDQAEAFTPIIALRNTVVGISGAVALLASLLGLVVARSITRPMNQLVAGAEEIGRGNLDQRIEVRARHEFGQLAGAFNQMAASLGDSLGETAYGQRMVLALSQASQAVLRARSEEEVYRTVGDEVARLGYDATIYRLSEDRTSLAIAHVTFPAPMLRAAEKLVGVSVHSFRMPLVPGGFFERAIGSQESVFADSPAEITAEALPRPLRPLAGQLVALLGGPQTIFAPLLVGGETHGLVAVSGSDLRETDVPAVTAFANQAAIAVENAMATEELRKHRDHLEELVDERAAQIRRTNERLEAEVAERRRAESDLQATLAELEASRTAALNMMLDADDARGLLEQANRDLGAEVAERRRTEEALQKTLAELRASRAAALNMMKDAEEARRLADQVNVDLRREIEERKRVEEELERSNRELEQFAYVASHDLQEPLRKLQVFGDRLRAKQAEALDERGLDYLDRMQDAAGRMQRMINDLLDFSRVTTRGQPMVSVNLRRLARETVSDLEVHIEQAGGDVEIGDLPKVEADPTQMRQLLTNLIGNGLKFRREGVAPVVKVTSERISGPDGGLCRILVTDNGIGFDEKYLGRIFRPFERLHGRGMYPGTGIGLAICRKIAERHGGSITARSAPGEGATFIVTLPVKQGVGSRE